VNAWAACEVWIERGERDSPVARAVVERLGKSRLRWFDGADALPPASVRSGKRILVVERHKGRFLRHCPAGTAGLVCCNYLVVNLGSNCPLDCTYCFLQEYLADNPLLRVYSNVDEALAEVAGVVDAHPERSFRIGTGELTDSLALDPVTGMSRLLVPFFAARPNVRLELKTKTDCIETLLELEPRGQVVVSWSVNARQVVDGDELGTAGLDARLAAARRVQAAGYLVGFHFDPLVEFEGWEKAYGDLVRDVFATVDRDRIAWVSLGSLRVSPGLRQAMRERGDAGHVLGAELVPCADGKARVWQGLRLRMYQHLARALDDVAPGVPRYMCMEGPDVWQRVSGSVPTDRSLGLRLTAGALW
jgi:DNA repair photolyase